MNISLRRSAKTKGAALHSIRTGPDSACLVRIYSGRGTVEGPGLVYFHGGYFTDGCIENAASLAESVSELATVIVVAYPLAPSSVFPHTLESCFTVLEWVMRHAASLRVDPSMLFIGGEQAGGALAAALAMVARDRNFGERQGQAGVAGQILVNPLLDPAQATPALREAHGHPSREAWASYLARHTDFNHPYASPLRSRRLAGLPPCLLLSERKDPLRDEAELYRKRLQEAGVFAQLVHPDEQASEMDLSDQHTGLAAARIKSFLRAMKAGEGQAA